MFKKIQDPVSALTHFVGFVAAIPLMCFFIIYSAKYYTMYHVVSLAIFGAALLLLYGASFIYHMIPVSHEKKEIFRRVDHMMIFVLIAGTYTPVCLVPLRGAWGYTLLSIIWVIAAAGIILKACWMNAPRVLSTSIYVIMGWLVIIAFYPLAQSVSMGGVLLLVLGGVTYTLGAVIYALKWPKINFNYFGFHELFHLFVMGGSLFHILFMLLYLMY